MAWRMAPLPVTFPCASLNALFLDSGIQFPKGHGQHRNICACIQDNSAILCLRNTPHVVLDPGFVLLFHLIFFDDHPISVFIAVNEISRLTPHAHYCFLFSSKKSTKALS